MDATIQGEITLIYVKHGVSKKEANYLILANGRKEFPVFGLDDDDLKKFDGLSEGQEVTMDVILTAGTDSVKIVDVIR